MENSSIEDFTSELQILRVIVYKHRHTHRRSDHLHGLHRLQKWSEKFLQCPDERSLEELRRCAVTCSCKLGGLIAHGHFLNYSLMSLAMVARLATLAERMVAKGKGARTNVPASTGAPEQIDSGEALQRPFSDAEKDGEDDTMDFGEAIARRTVVTSSDEEDVGEVVIRCDDERKEKDRTRECGFEIRGDSSGSEAGKKMEHVKSGCEIQTRLESEKEKMEGIKSKQSGFEIRGDDSESEDEEKTKDIRSRSSGCEIRRQESLPAQVTPDTGMTAPRSPVDQGEARGKRPRESTKKRQKKRRKS